MDEARNTFKNDADLKYALDASRDYRPQHELSHITTQVFALNFSDDELNPEQLHILESCMRHVRNGSYIVQRNDTQGHATANYPQLWAHHVANFLKTLFLRKHGSSCL
jgi:homoserine O-acetyltransferase